MSIVAMSSLKMRRSCRIGLKVWLTSTGISIWNYFRRSLGRRRVRRRRRVSCLWDIWRRRIILLLKGWDIYGWGGIRIIRSCIWIINRAAWSSTNLTHRSPARLVRNPSWLANHKKTSTWGPSSSTASIVHLSLRTLTSEIKNQSRSIWPESIPIINLSLLTKSKGRRGSTLLQLHWFWPHSRKLLQYNGKTEQLRVDLWHVHWFSTQFCSLIPCPNKRMEPSSRLISKTTLGNLGTILNLVKFTCCLGSTLKNWEIWLSMGFVHSLMSVTKNITSSKRTGLSSL